MTWAKLDDEFYDHPKVLQAGLAAVGLFAVGLSYSARKLTDGFLAFEVVARLGPGVEVEALATRLVEVGLWETTPGGYLIHDYLAFNPSGKHVKRERKVAAERMQNHRGRSRPVRANITRTASEHSQNTTRSSPSPVPVPVPQEDTDQKGEERESISAARFSSEASRRGIERFVELYHAVLPQLPRVVALSGARRRKIAARIHDHPLAWWQGVFVRAAKVPFLAGENDRGWRADLNWFIANDENALKVLEGKYDGSPRRTSNSGRPGKPSVTDMAREIAEEMGLKGVAR